MLHISKYMILNGAISLIELMKKDNDPVIHKLVKDAVISLDATWLKNTVDGDDSMLIAIEECRESEADIRKAYDTYNEALANGDYGDPLIDKARVQHEAACIRFREAMRRINNLYEQETAHE